MSEPIFEASVRLRADTKEFEEQAQASIQRTAQKVEQSAKVTVPVQLAPPKSPESAESLKVLGQLSARIKAGNQAVEVPIKVTGAEQQAAEAKQRVTSVLVRDPFETSDLFSLSPQREALNNQLEELGRKRQEQEQAALAASRQGDAEVESMHRAQVARLESESMALRHQIDQIGALEAKQTSMGVEEFEAAADDFAQMQAAAQEATQGALTSPKLPRGALSGLKPEDLEFEGPAGELKTQAETAGLKAEAARLRGESEEAHRQQLAEEVLNRQAELVKLEQQQREFGQLLKTSSGTDKEQLLAAAERTAAASAVLRQEIATIQTTGRVPTPPQQERGFFDTITGPGGILRSRSGSSSLLGILGTTARFGVAGLAFGAAFSTLNELQQSLHKTGEEAFTVEGRFSNLGAELLRGNFIGGIKALVASRPAELVGELGDAVTATIEKQKAANDPLILSQEKLNLVHQQGQEAVDAYIFSLVEGEHVTLSQAAALLQVNGKLDSQQKLVDTTADAWANYSAQVEKAGGSVTAAFGPDNRAGPKGPGAFPTSPTGAPAGTVIGRQRTGIPRDIIAVGPNPAFQAGTGGQDVGNQIRESIISRIQDEQERLQAELRSARVVQAQKRAAFETAKEAARAAGGGEQAAAAYRDLVLATTKVKDAAAAVAANAVANAEAIAAAGDRARDAATARIGDPNARLAAQRTNALQDEREAQAALEKAKKAGKNAREISEAEATYQEARTARANIEREISETAKEAARTAAEDVRNAHELRLANNIAAAAITATRADDKKFYNEAIDYYRGVASDTSRTATEREQARGTVRELRQGLKQALSGGGDELRLAQIQNALSRAEQVGSIPLQRRAAQRLVDFWEEQFRATRGIERAQAQASLISARGQLLSANRAVVDLQEQRIRNRVQAAQLTEGLGDDQRAADALIKFWREQVKHATGLEKERARAQLISAQLAKQGLEDVKDTTTVFDLLTDTASRFAQFAGNLRDSNNPFTRESFVGEQAQFFRPGVTPDQIVAGPTGFTADLNAFRERNDRLSRIPGSGVEATDRNTDAINRLTDTLTGRIPGIQRGDSGSIPTGRRVTSEEAAGLRGEAMGTFWKARQARMATESGVGAAGAGF